MTVTPNPVQRRWGMHLGGGAVLTGLLLAGLVLLPVRAQATTTTVITTTTTTTDPQQVTICHRTNAVTNPYTVNRVAVSAVDGSLGNGSNDHTHHLGAVFDPAVVYPAPHNGDQWGDIIPPYQYGSQPVRTFPGMNWTDEGELIWRAECTIPSTTTTTEATTTTTEATTTTPSTTTTTEATTTTTEATTTTPSTTTTTTATTSSSEATTSTTGATSSTAASSTSETTPTTPPTLPAEVLGETIPRNALAVTGFRAGLLVTLGAALVGLGLALMVATKRQQRHTS